jgi:hypothetical protein
MGDEKIIRFGILPNINQWKNRRLGEDCQLWYFARYSYQPMEEEKAIGFSTLPEMFNRRREVFQVWYMPDIYQWKKRRLLGLVLCQILTNGRRVDFKV